MTVPTDSPVLDVLFAEDDTSLATAIGEVLATSRSPRFRVTHVGRLSEALVAIRSRRFDVALLDLTLPDAQELEAPVSLRNAAPDLPVVILTGIDDERLVEENARAGVQDYLLKGEITSRLLVRTLRYAVERFRLLREVHALMIRDELTGLYNRRGFFTVGEQQLRLAERMAKSFLVVYLDVDNLKECNDRHGHRHGDELLRRMARVLTRTFRESDVAGRLGGDEFAVLSLDAGVDGAEAVTARLRRNLAEENAAGRDAFPLEVSIGLSLGVPPPGSWLGNLVRQADARMYAEKRGKKAVAAGA